MNMSRFSLLLSAALFIAPAMINANALDTVEQQMNSIVNTEEKIGSQLAEGAEKADQQIEEGTKQVVEGAEKAVNTITHPTTTTTTTVPETTGDKVSAEAKGIMAAISAFVAARNKNVLDGLDFVAAYSINPVLTKLADVCGCAAEGSKFRSNIPTINKVVVTAALVGLGYAAYQAYQNQNATEDFDNDFDADNN